MGQWSQSTTPVWSWSIEATPARTAEAERSGVSDVPASFLLFASATVVPTALDASGSTTDLDAVTAKSIGLALPWMLLLIVLVLAALVVLALGQRRRRLAQAKDREDARVTEAVELALERVQ